MAPEHDTPRPFEKRTENYGESAMENNPFFFGEKDAAHHQAGNPRSHIAPAHQAHSHPPVFYSPPGYSSDKMIPVPVRSGGNINDSDTDFSYDVQEIMARTPHWLLRCGTSVVAGVIGVLVFLTWVIHYPDQISATMTITGVNPAVKVVARQNGHLDQLLVEENQIVEKGQILAIIESPSDPRRVFAVEDGLRSLMPFLSDPGKFHSVGIRSETRLGRLQEGYSTFYSRYLAYINLLGEDYAEKSIALLKKQLSFQQTRIENVQGQAEGARRVLELAREKYSRSEKLHARGSLSTSELEDQERALLATGKSQADTLKSLTAEEVTALELQKQIQAIQHERTEALNKATAELQESFKKVLSDIEIWETEHVLRAPIAGTVAFYDIWTDRQYVSKDSEVFVIAPDSSSLVGRMEVKGNGVGKIESGQTVYIKFSDYAYNEFGMVTGKVRSVSIVSRKGAHLVMVDIDYPLVTNYNKEIPFSRAMQANASIITQDLRLLERIFYQIRKAFVSAVSSGKPSDTSPKPG